MNMLRSRRALFENLEDRLGKRLAELSSPVAAEMEGGGSHLQNLAITAAWVAGGLGVVALGLIAGRELRGRYKFKRRTPYDYYAHSGDRSPDLDYSVGI